MNDFDPMLHNKSLKPTVTHVTHFAEKAKPAPRYGSLVPPFYTQILLIEIATKHLYL